MNPSKIIEEMDISFKRFTGKNINNQIVKWLERDINNSTYQGPYLEERLDMIEYIKSNPEECENEFLKQRLDDITHDVDDRISFVDSRISTLVIDNIQNMTNQSNRFGRRDV